jgi:hypothetical protein
MIYLIDIHIAVTEIVFILVIILFTNVWSAIVLALILKNIKK